MLRGSSPIQLSQLDISPAIQAGALEQQAAVNLAGSINQAVQDFQAKQEEKKQDKIGIKAIQNMFGLDDTTARAVYKDEVVRDSFTTLLDSQATQGKVTQTQQNIQSISAANPNLPMKYVEDLALKRALPEYDKSTDIPTFLGFRMSDGKLIDPSTYGFSTGPSVSATTKTTTTTEEGDEYFMPSFGDGTRGLYGELIRLDEQGDAPTGVEQGAMTGISNLFARFTGAGGDLLNPDIRRYKSEIDLNINKIADALRMNEKYSTRELERLEKLVESLRGGTFRSVTEVKSTMEALDRRIANEERRLTNILQNPKLAKGRRADLQSALDAQKAARNILGVNLYEESSLQGINTSDLRDSVSNFQF
jgi:hypothetical protein